MDKHAVTNKQFEDFVDATGYKTEAELYRYLFVGIFLNTVFTVLLCTGGRLCCKMKSRQQLPPKWMDRRVWEESSKRAKLIHDAM